VYFSRRFRAASVVDSFTASSAAFLMTRDDRHAASQLNVQADFDAGWRSCPAGRLPGGCLRRVERHNGDNRFISLSPRFEFRIGPMDGWQIEAAMDGFLGFESGSLTSFLRRSASSVFGQVTIRLSPVRKSPEGIFQKGTGLNRESTVSRNELRRVSGTRC
jgi:hypothetical protein